MCEEGASKFYSEENEDDEDEEADFSEDLVSEDIIGLSAPTKEKEGRTISVKLDKAEPIGEAGGEVANPVPSLNNEYGSGLGTFEKLESEEDYPSVEDEAETESAPMSPNQVSSVVDFVDSVSSVCISSGCVCKSDVGNEKGDKPSDTISDSGTNRENLAAVGNYWVKKGGSKPTLQNRSLFFLFESWRRWSFCDFEAVPLWPPKNYMGFHPVSIGQTNCGIRFAEWRDTFCCPAGSVLPPFLAGWLGLMGPTVLGDRLEF
ncbi:hypothetical protein U1Q18_009839 [Sarracenia purpurea var. burkii]